MSEPYATRREVEIMAADAERTHAELGRRLDALDALGSRGVIALQVQVTDLAKDVAAVKQQLTEHDRVHERDERDRRSARRWLVGAIIASVAAVDGPLVTLLLARH